MQSAVGRLVFKMWQPSEEVLYVGAFTQKLIIGTCLLGTSLSALLTYGPIIVCMCKQNHVCVCKCVHMLALSASVEHVPRVTETRYIIVSCQGNIARELALLTHMDIRVCQVTAWTILVSLQTSLALNNNNAC